MKPRIMALLISLFTSVVISLAVASSTVTHAASPPKPTISQDASSAVARMGKSLQAKAFSFGAQTIRVYEDQNGEQLHIAHEFKVTVRRPDRLLIDGTGDDGPRKLVYDGNSVVLALDDGKEYATIPVPNTIQRMMQVVMGHFGVDFPLADFLTDDPAKAFLMGVTSGREVNVATIGGVQCRHLVFLQPPGIQLELWLEDNDQSLPRRLIVTYRSLPGEPNFVAEMSDWNFSVQPSDAQFKFEAPQGAQQLEFGAALKQSTGAKQ